MANGKPGDHPYTDIVVHGQEAISPSVTRSVKEIYKFGDDRLNAITRSLVWNMRPELANESWRPLILEELELDLRFLVEIGQELNKASRPGEAS
jgi:hypothetical protein